MMEDCVLNGCYANNPFEPILKDHQTISLITP
jgi:hypothetical protein